MARWGQEEGKDKVKVNTNPIYPLTTTIYNSIYHSHTSSNYLGTHFFDLLLLLTFAPSIDYSIYLSI